MRVGRGILASVAIALLTLLGTVSPGLLSPASASTGPQASPLVSGLSSPNGMATNAAGDLFIADAGSNSITVVPGPATTSSTSILGQTGLVAGEATTLSAPFSDGVSLYNPNALAVDAAGDLYIANNGDADVVVVPTSTTTLFGQAVNANEASVLSATYNTLLTNPQGVALDQAGDLFVSDYSNQAVYVLPASGTSSVFGQTVTPPGPGSPSSLTQLNAASDLVAPAPLAFDSAGDLYIGDQGNGQVDVVPADDTASGATLFGQSVTADTLTPVVSGLQTPGGLAIDSAGDLFVTDFSSGALDVLAAGSSGSTSTVLQQSASANTLTPLPNAPSLGEPSGLALDSYGDLYVADYESGNVYELQSGNEGGVMSHTPAPPPAGTPQPCSDYPDKGVPGDYYDFATERTTVYGNAGYFHCGQTVPPQVDYGWEAAEGDISVPAGSSSFSSGDSITRVNASLQMNFSDGGYIAVGWLQGWVDFTGPRPLQASGGQCKGASGVDQEGLVDLTRPEIYVQVAGLPGSPDTDKICDEGAMPSGGAHFSIWYSTSGCWNMEVEGVGIGDQSGTGNTGTLYDEECSSNYPSALPSGGAVEAGLSMYSLRPPPSGSCTTVPNVTFGGDTDASALALSRSDAPIAAVPWQAYSGTFPYSTIRYDESTSINPTTQLAWPNGTGQWSYFTASIGSNSGCTPPNFPQAPPCTYWANVGNSGTYYHFAQEMTADSADAGPYHCGPLPDQADFSWSGILGSISAPSGPLVFPPSTVIDMKDNVTRISARLMVSFAGGGYIAVGWTAGTVSINGSATSSGQCNFPILSSDLSVKTYSTPELYVEANTSFGSYKLCQEGPMTSPYMTFGIYRQGPCWTVTAEAPSTAPSLIDKECGPSLPVTGAVVAGLSMYSFLPSCATVPAVTFGGPLSAVGTLPLTLQGAAGTLLPWQDYNEQSFPFGTMRYDESTSTDPTTQPQWPLNLAGYQWSYFKASVSPSDDCDPPQFQLVPPTAPDLDFQAPPWAPYGLYAGPEQTPPPVPEVATGSLPAGAVGSAYSTTQLQATDPGFVDPSYTWSYSGLLPPGLSLNSSGAISGTPTTAGTYNFTVQAADQLEDVSAVQPLSITIYPALSITTSSSLSGTQYEPISATFDGAGGLGAANGGAYAFSLGGTLPPGCTASSMNPDGAFSCLPTTPGNYTLTVVLQNDIGETSLSSTSVNFPFVVTAPPSLSISTSSLLTGTEYQTIAATFYGAGGLGAANGGAYVFSLGGNLPPGCSTSSMSPNGYFSCLPTTPGHYTLTVVLQNDIGQIALGSTSVGYPFVVAAPPALSITPSSISSATIDTAYGVTFSGAGGITAPNGGAYKFLISGGNLPPGCTTSSMSAGGYFSCTPAQTGSYTFTVTLQNEIGQLGVGSTSLNVTLVVVLPSPLSITPSSIPSATPNASYAVTFSGAGGVTAPKGGAYDFLITGGNLPSGCSTSSMSAGGQFSCTPSVPGSYTFTVTLQNDIGQTVVGSTSENVTLTVLPFPTPLSITTSSVPDGSISASYGTVLKGTGGSNIGYTWQVVRGGVPGLSLSFYNGTLSGTPSAAGVYSFTVQLNDNAGDSAQASYTMVVAPLSITAPSAVDSATVGSPYSAKFSATGGCGCSYSYWVSGGSIPSWLNFNGNGYMSGTPNTSGRYNFTVAVSDGAGNSATVPVTLTVSGYGQLSISSTAFQSGLQVGSGFAVTFSGAGGCGCGYNWSIASGGVPGLSLTSSGWLHGTVTTPGVYSFTVLVQDGAGNVAEETYTVLVDE